MTLAPTTKPLGTFLIAIFLAVATCVLVAVGTALAFPGSKLEAIWQLYPARRALLMPYRVWLVPGLGALTIPMMSGSIGCFRHRKWGWRLAVAIIALNGLGDVTQLAMGHFLAGGAGLAAAGVILFYLSRPSVRNAFSKD